MIDNRSFRPPQMYLEYLDKLKILNEMQMLHLPSKLCHSALSETAVAPGAGSL